MKRRKKIEIGEVLVSVQIERLESGDYLATSQELPDLLAQGRTIAETLEIAQDVLRKLIDSYLEHGDPLPKGRRIEEVKKLAMESFLSPYHPPLKKGGRGICSRSIRKGIRERG